MHQYERPREQCVKQWFSCRRGCASAILAGVPTLSALIERINGIGARWRAGVPGVGELKAARILDWLHANEEVLGLPIGQHMAQPRAQLSVTTLATVGADCHVPGSLWKVRPAARAGWRGGRIGHPSKTACSRRSTIMRRSAPGEHPSGRAMPRATCPRRSALPSLVI